MFITIQSIQQTECLLAKFLPASLLGVSVDFYQRAVVGESGMIKIHTGKHNRSVMVAVHGTP
jgi:hypothetical protein